MTKNANLDLLYLHSQVEKDKALLKRSIKVRFGNYIINHRQFNPAITTKVYKCLKGLHEKED